MTAFVSNLPPPSTGVVHIQPETEAFVGSRCLGRGTLHITESQLSWQGTSTFSIEYPSIGIHAISTDPALSPNPCLLVQVTGDLLGQTGSQSSNGEMENRSDDEDEENDDEKTTEIKFVPQDPSSLETLYSHMSRCQALHPDPDDSISEEEEEEEEEFYDGGEEDDGEGGKHLPSGGAGDEPMDMSEGQFEDA